MQDRESPNRAALISVARAVRELLPDLVFVGGHVTELLVTDDSAVRIGVTDDVDVIVESASPSDFHRVEDRLRALGLVNDQSLICRWRTREGMVLDVMPTDPSILGFTNVWYRYAIESATTVQIEEMVLRIVSAPGFLATKWAAYEHRGRGDVYGSRDAEDIILVVAGRESIVNEVAEAPREVRAYIARSTAEFLADEAASSAIEGALPDAPYVPGLIEHVMRRFIAIRDLGTA